jgi:hypothetical protein
MNLQTRIERLEMDMPGRNSAVALLVRIECERRGVPFNVERVPIGVTFVDLLRSVQARVAPDGAQP